MTKASMTAHAKINLLLSVLGKRPDGYHDIESLMQFVEFGDEVTVELTDNKDITVQTNIPDLPTDRGNIAYRAAELMQKTYNLSCGFAITILKKIPVAAGLAGGSTNGAAVMHLINRLCGLSLSFPELAALGVTLGADMPFCLYGKPALCEGIGEKITPCTGLKDCYILLVNPGVGVSTGTIYQALDGHASRKKGDKDRLAEDLKRGDLSKSMANMINVMEPVAQEFCPPISDLLALLKKAGADHAMMSGSGATCFGIFKEKPNEEAMRALFKDAFVCITKPIGE